MWAQGGTLPALQPPLLLLGAWVFATLLFHLRGRILIVLRRDPLFWLGLLFLLLLVIQTWNAGRHLYFHPFEARWMFTPPPVPYLPWSFDRSESFQMLYWFAPAWALALALRHAPDRKRTGRVLLYFVMINGILLAVAGMVQWMAGTPFLFRHTRPAFRLFYATFAYRNHAGAYLVLVLAAVLGFLSYQIRWRHRAGMAVRAPVIWGTGFGGIVLVTAIHTSLSRAAILLSWVLIAWFLAALVVGRIGRGRVGRLQVGLVLALVLFITSIWVIILGGDAFRTRTQSLHTWAHQVENRQWQWETAVRIWQDHPVWGVGGWGYRHLLPYYVDEAFARSAGDPGKANVHNDALQFLAEFGGVGLALLLGALVVTGAGFVRAWQSAREQPASAVFTMVFAGLLLVGLHSLIDLPFRNPAVLYTVVILLVAVPAAWSNLRAS